MNASDHLNPQRGVALITAMLVVVLGTLLLVGMSTEQQLDIRRTATLLNVDQAYQDALGGESWAMGVLRRDKGATDGLADDWAMSLAPIQVEGGVATGKIIDLQGRFNLNSLLKEGKPSELEVARLQRLLTILELDPGLVNALLDWMDVDQEVRQPGGAESGTYMSLEPPYPSAGRLFTSVTELYLIAGVDKELFRKLEPLVAVLPGWTAINVNTAPVEILMALGEGIERSDAEALVDSREIADFSSVDKFVQSNILVGKTIAKDGLDVGSHYFLVNSQVNVGRGRMQLFSLLKRDKGKVTVQMRGQGVM
ncbi:MAG: type II secretion system minor pseudopilin GspK [Magnetococcus sp. DMHC-6]